MAAITKESRTIEKKHRKLSWSFEKIVQNQANIYNWPSWPNQFGKYVLHELYFANTYAHTKSTRLFLR